MPTAIQHAFAPSGTLRASINTGNPILAKANGDSAVGVSVDLAQRLALALALPLELVVFDKAAHSVQAVEQGLADIGFFAVDPLRGQHIAFTWPYVLIEGAYMVSENSPIKNNAAVDEVGHRVIVGQGSAYDLFLTRHLKKATIIRVNSSQAVVQAFLAGEGDVAAGVKQQLIADSQGHPSLKLLEGRFMVIEQAMGMAKSRGVEAIAYLRQFVERAKADGFIASALNRHQINGAGVGLAADPNSNPLGDQQHK